MSLYQEDALCWMSCLMRKGKAPREIQNKVSVPGNTAVLIMVGRWKCWKDSRL